MEDVDTKIKKLIKLKSELYRKEYNREITSEELEAHLDTVQDELNRLNTEKIKHQQAHMFDNNGAQKVNERVKDELKGEGIDIQELQAKPVEREVKNETKPAVEEASKVETATEKNPVTKPITKGKTRTRTEVFVQMLADETVTTLEEAVARIRTELPGMKPHIIKFHLWNFIGQIKRKQHKKYADYEFDKGSFTIRKVVQQKI